MTYDEAKALRMRQIQGGEVEPRKLQRALFILSQPEPEPEPARTSPAATEMRGISNPWGLTGREAASLDAVIQHGRAKTAAQAMGISHRTIELYFRSGRKKMGVTSLVSAAVLWDRHVRGDAA